MGTHEHRKKGPDSVRLGILTATTTRTLETDESGQWLKKRALKEGHSVVVHRTVADDAEAIRSAVREAGRLEPPPQVLLVNGGTGITRKDVTIEAIRPLFFRELTAFSILFTQLSFEEIDSAALLSRACAGLVEDMLVFLMPGSLKACQLAAKALIFPELGHLVGHLTQE